jgi:hypothetical protein
VTATPTTTTTTTTTPSPVATATPGTEMCTLSPGGYGSPGGAANGSDGVITQNPGVFPALVGVVGPGPSVTINNQASLIAFVPTGGTSNMLCGNAQPAPCPGDLVVNSSSDIPDPSGAGSNGYGGGVLTGQGLALVLSVSLSTMGATPPALASVPLPAASFCTCKAGTPKAGPFTIPATVHNAADTVGDLMSISNQALSGAPLNTFDPALSYADLTTALAAINLGFDGCRSFCSCN